MKVCKQVIGYLGRILILLSSFCIVSIVWSDIQFEEVSEQVGITRVGESWGNAWGDFDGDGYLDLWATNHKHKPSLYRNNGDGTFTDIIDEVWDANPLADTHGVAWADFDNDGDQDLIVLSGSGGGRSGGTNPKQDNHFYVNENGMLIERAAELNIDFPLLRGRTPLWFDSNRDGRLDVLLTGILRTDGTGDLVTSTLFQQTPSGFKDVSTASGCLIEKSSSLAQLADITGNGSMDLVIHGNPYPNEVYDISGIPFRNLVGNLNFPKRYQVQDAVYADFNRDLTQDVFLARGVYRSYINAQNSHKIKMSIFANMEEKGLSFKARGEIRFEIYSVWATWLSHLSIGSSGYRLTEFDGEFIGADPVRNAASFKFVLSPDDPRVAGLKARPDVESYGIYVGYEPTTEKWTLLYHTRPRIKTVGNVTMDAVIEAAHPIAEIEPINFSVSDLHPNPQSFLLTNRDNRFELTATFLDGCSVSAGDFDNDMDLDLYLVRSSSAGNLPNHLYENQGDGTFIRKVGSAGAEGSTEGKGQSVTIADYDLDGDLDLFVTNGRGGYPFNNGPDQLFRNIGNGNNWLQIDLEGTVSNRDGIGARLFAATPDGKIQLRENGGGIHWCQQDQKRIHFGLAQNEKVSELTVYWPSGIIQKLTSVPVNQVLHVVEPHGPPDLAGDVNQDRQVDIIDFVIVVKHFGEKAPTEPRADVNKDGEVNILDLLWIIKAVDGKLTVATAPSHNPRAEKASETNVWSLHYQLSEGDIDRLYAFYGNIEEISDDVTQIKLVRHFLRRLLRLFEGPLETKLYPNYPNPFNPETWIPYQLAEDTEVKIRVYDVSGHLVRTVFSGHQAVGYYLSRNQAAYWDGRNEVGERVAGGVYIYELKTDTFQQTGRFVLIK